MSTAAAAPTCPNCSREYVRRVHRQGIYERISSLFYIYPFRCQLCSHRFLFRQTGIRYRKIFFDRREYDRLPVCFPVAIDSDRIKGDGTALEISMGGCSFETETELSPGSIVELQLKPFGDRRSVRIEAAVVRSCYPKRIGVEFLTLAPAEKEKLQFFVRGLLANPSSLTGEKPVNRFRIPGPDFQASRNPQESEASQTWGR